MAFLNSIKNAGFGLKKVETKDYSKPNFTEYDEKENENQVLDYNIEEWFEYLGDCTFKTVLVPLTQEDAQFFKDACQLVVLDRKPLTAELELYRDETLIAKLSKPIHDLAKAGSGFVFVKNSSRSPKDAPILLDGELRQTWKKIVMTKNPKDENDRILAILEAGTEMLKVDNAKRAVDLCIHSKRMYADMKIALNQNQRFKENFVIREHVDIDAMTETRGIVFGNRLNALSQYHAAIYIPAFVNQGDQLVKAVQKFFEETVAPRMAKWESVKGNYVVDFAFERGKPFEAKYCWVIEINPYLMNSDACMFMWSRDKERFENGPFEFRFNRKRTKTLGVTLEGPWKKLLEEETKKLLEELNSNEVKTSE